MVVPEVDDPPTNAASLRIASVNQKSTASQFTVYMNNGQGTLVDNDFLFMVTGR